MTNPAITDEKHEVYQTHVRELYDTNSPSRYIKLSDFIDNCLGLNTFSQSLRYKLALKYRPLIPIMMEFVLGSKLLKLGSREDAVNDLIEAGNLCRIVVETPGFEVGSATLWTIHGRY